MTKLKRWLPLLALTIVINVKSTLTLPLEDARVDDQAKLVGSSIIASVSVTKQEKNGTSSPDSRKVVPAYEPLASPADLLRPDRFQFYTFNNNGEVVTKQMTEKEIQSLIAAGGGHYPMEIHEPMKTENMLGEETKVADVVQNVQNVLKGELSKPTTMMVPVPTVPGHATDEWSNILPSILSGDSETNHPANGISQFDDDKSTMPAKPTIHQATNMYDSYKPQPAIILEMEPHVHESPSQIHVSSDYLDHHVRPLNAKPQSMKPDTEQEDSSLDKVPLQTWNAPSKGQDFHYITTEIVPPQKNYSESKTKLSTPKPVTIDAGYKKKNTTAEQTLNMYSEIPMIPVSVITADQILTSTQKNKINERPVFQMLSTISPSAVASPAKQNDTMDQKSDDIIIISETHSTSVKYSGQPEMKVTGEGSQSTVPVKIKPTMDEKNTTSQTTSSLMTDATTQPSVLTTYSNTVENLSAVTSQDNVTPMILINDSLPTVTTEMSSEMFTETTVINDATNAKDIYQQNMNETTVGSTPTDKPMTTVTDQMFNKITVTDKTKDETSTIYEYMSTTPLPIISGISENDEILTSDLANSLSSVISQVAETIPSILTDTQNFPLSELKSKNISMSNDMFESTTKDLPEEFSTVADDFTTESASTPLNEQTTADQTTFATEISSEKNDNIIWLTEKPELIFERIPDTTLQSDITTNSVTEDKLEMSTIPTIISSTSPESDVNSTESMVTNKSTEKDTEATIIHLDVTGAPADANVPQYTTEDGKNTSESPLIRIQLADIVSAVNHVIDNAPLKSEMPSNIQDMTLPPDPYSVSSNIGSGLIAGFLPNTMQDIRNNETYSNATETSTVEYNSIKDNINNTNSSFFNLDNKNNVESSSMSNKISAELQNTTPMQSVITEMTSNENKVETTISVFNENTSESSTLRTDQSEESTVQVITTPESVTLSSEMNKTKKPEAPIVRIDVSPESTSSNLPPRIQLTDLPILQESTTPSNSVKESEIMNITNSNEKPSLYNTTDNVNTEKLTTGSDLPNKDTDLISTQVPCTFDTKDLSRCQNYSEESKLNITKTNEEIKIDNTYSNNKTNNEVIADNTNVNATKNDADFIKLPSDIVNIQESSQNSQILPNKLTNHVQMTLKNESALLKPSLNNESSTESVIHNNINLMKNESNVNIIETLNKQEIMSSTSMPIKNIPSKQDSYIKLGEQLTKEQLNKTSGNSTKIQKPGIKRPPSSTTIRPSTNKVSSSTFTTSNKMTPKPTKAPPTTVQSTTAEKTPESVTEINMSNEDQKWTLIPQQSTSAFSIKNKQDVSESPVSSSTMFPNGELNDFAHRTGSKPVNLEVVKNSAGLDDSVRNLDQDIKFFSNLCNELAFSFWTSANKGLSNSRSLALSPFGMTSMLAMIFLGARGPTSAQMNDILKLDDVASFNPHLVFQNITDAVSLARNQGIANAAFVRLLFADRIKVGKLMPFYKEQAQKFYEGFVTEVNFSTISDQVKRRTNLLVRKQTGGRIKDFVKTNTVPLRSPLAALSANVFQTNCNSTGASSEGRDGEMYFAVSPAVRQRRLVPVPATVWRSGVLAGYEPGLDATAIALGGTEKLVSTIFVIPGQQGFTAPGDTLDRLEQRLMRSAYRDKAWDKLLKVIVPRPALELQVPKFSHRSVVNATAALKRMGLEELFSRHANLKGINGFGHDIHLADVLQMNLFSTCGDENISSGRHHVETYPGSVMRNNRKTDLEMQATSFEFTKATTSESSESSEMFMDEYTKNPRLIKSWSRDAEISEKPRLRLDRPFLYFVRHNPTGLILHMGRFNPRLLQ